MSGVSDFTYLSVCVRVGALKEKRLELSTQNLVVKQSMTVARQAITTSLKGQRSRSRGYEMRYRRGYAGGYDRSSHISRIISRNISQLRVTVTEVLLVVPDSGSVIG